MVQFINNALVCVRICQCAFYISILNRNIFYIFEIHFNLFLPKFPKVNYKSNRYKKKNFGSSLTSYYYFFYIYVIFIFLTKKVLKCFLLLKLLTYKMYHYVVQGTIK